MYEVFLDTETTGLSYGDGHKIVEIACIETKDLIPTGNIFHKIINPKRSMPETAFNVHGFSEEFLKDKETFDKIVNEFEDFIKKKKIIIHNAPFDLGFLNGELSAIKKKKIDKAMVIDSLEVARNNCLPCRHTGPLKNDCLPCRHTGPSKRRREFILQRRRSRRRNVFFLPRRDCTEIILAGETPNIPGEECVQRRCEGSLQCS